MKTILKMILCMSLFPFFLNAENNTKDHSEPPEFDKLWNYSNPSESEDIFKEIYTNHKDSATNSYLTQLLTQLARSQGLQGKFEEGFVTIAEAQTMCLDTDLLSRVRILLETGRLQNSSGDKESAKKIFLEAKDLALAEKLDIYAIDAIHMLGIVDLPEKQLEWNLLAIEITEKTDDERAKGWLGPLLNNTGWSYFDMKKYDNAMELFEKSLNFREKIGDKNGTRIAKWTIARTLRAQNKFKEALGIQLNLETEIDSLEIAKDGYIYEELGELYLELNEVELSKYYFRLAYPLLSSDPWLQKNEAERLARIKLLME